jgi:hypothetical protein
MLSPGITVESGPFFYVSDAELFQARGPEVIKHEITGKVILFSLQGGTAYYVSSLETEEGGSENIKFFTGRAGTEPDAPLKEISLEDIKSSSLPIRISGSGDNIYITVKPAEDGETFVLKTDMMTGNVSRIEGAVDSASAGGLPVLLTGGASPALTYNDSAVSLAISGSGYIASVSEDRFVTVKSGTGSVMVDLLAMRDIYHYPDGAVYLTADQSADNLIIEITDEPGSPYFDIPVFYRVFADLKEVGRTETGPAGSVRIFRMKSDPGGICHIKLERWSLNIVRERYERDNNINQPKTFTVRIPDSFIMKVSVTYDGQVYSIVRSPVKYEIMK